MRGLSRRAAVAQIVRYMAARKLPKTLSSSEIDALFARPNRAAPTGLRNLCMLTLMYRCGLRVSETCKVQLRDVRIDDGQIHLRPEVAKGGREAFVYLDDRSTDLLRSWIVVRRQYAARKPRLFTTLKGGEVSRKYVWEMTARYSRRAGIERPVHPHMLRHTYATELLRDGFNLREVQQLLRHADVRTTVIYTHIFEADLARKIQQRG
jgi:integrase/recombinase XerD